MTATFFSGMGLRASSAQRQASSATLVTRSGRGRHTFRPSAVRSVTA